MDIQEGAIGIAQHIKNLEEEIERLREALKKIAESECETTTAGAWTYCIFVAQAALQQKDSE